jgi:hypothetical protein
MKFPYVADSVARYTLPDDGVVISRHVAVKVNILLYLMENKKQKTVFEL